MSSDDEDSALARLFGGLRRHILIAGGKIYGVASTERFMTGSFCGELSPELARRFHAWSIEIDLPIAGVIEERERVRITFDAGGGRHLTAELEQMQDGCCSVSLYRSPGVAA